MLFFELYRVVWVTYCVKIGSIWVVIYIFSLSTVNDLDVAQRIHKHRK